MSSETVVGPAAPAVTVIRAKLTVPPVPARRVERRRLEARVAQLIRENPAVVVSATAGAGKTTAVAAAVGLLDEPVAWLTVDPGDAAPGRLVTYLEAALASVLPRVAGTATDALAVGIPHPEAAGLLAEAVGGEGAVFVLDELETLGDDPEAWAVIAALVRYAPPGLRFVLLSRRRIPVALRPASPAAPALAALGEHELAFTVGEAAAALEMLGEDDIDAQAAVRETGGWVMGVLFEVWRSAEHIAGMGGEADPLNGYLSTQILDQLGEREREFLISTSLLDEVTVQRAEALGRLDAAVCMTQLMHVHLPVTWRTDELALRCHSRFREYLHDRLERRGAKELRALRRAHGILLAEEGLYAEATEELLAAGALPEAVAAAERVILHVVGRSDLAVAERWLTALAPARGSSAELTTAELMLALAREDFRSGVAVGDELSARGERDAFVQASELGAVTLLNCYTHLGRLDDANAVVAAVPPGPVAEVVKYMMGNLAGGTRTPRPPLTGGPLDAAILPTDYVYGRVAGLVDDERTGWIQAVAEPWRIGALSVTGHTERALELYEDVRARGIATAWVEAYFGPQVMIDAGRREDALQALERGRRLARATGSQVLSCSNLIEEARFALRIDRDPAAARATLDRLAVEPGVESFPVMSEQMDMWYGLALLMQSEDAQAREHLVSAVESMRAGDRVLELPTAAAYLAEAEWRLGDEDAADRAADLALEAARIQGSNHVLLRALADFPAVVSRRIDAEPAAGSPWHELGRALIAQGVAIDAQPRASIELCEFGAARILVNGEEVRPRIAKTSELLAYLTSNGGAATRDELLTALFDARDDESTRSYLRQAIRWLRRVLPDPDALTTEGGSLAFAPGVAVTSESTRFEASLSEAARLQGEDRLTATLEALALHESGEYLAGVETSWVDRRRTALAELASDARYEVAELAFAAERYHEAGELARRVVDDDPYREGAWRLLMRVANVMGDEDGVMRAYRACEQALATAGATPAASTQRLVDQLRR